MANTEANIHVYPNDNLELPAYLTWFFTKGGNQNIRAKAMYNSEEHCHQVRNNDKTLSVRKLTCTVVLTPDILENSDGGEKLQLFFLTCAVRIHTRLRFVKQHVYLPTYGGAVSPAFLLCEM